MTAYTAVFNWLQHSLIFWKVKTEDRNGGLIGNKTVGLHILKMHQFESKRVLCLHLFVACLVFNVVCCSDLNTDSSTFEDAKKFSASLSGDADGEWVAIATNEKYVLTNKQIHAVSANRTLPFFSDEDGVVEFRVEKTSFENIKSPKLYPSAYKFKLLDTYFATLTTDHAEYFLIRSGIDDASVRGKLNSSLSLASDLVEVGDISFESKTNSNVQRIANVNESEFTDVPSILLTTS